MFEKLNTPEKIFSCKLGCALTMESDVLEMLDELQRETQHEELRELFETHAEETRQHIRNIAECFRLLGEEPDDSPCPVVHAIEKDCNAAIENTHESIVDVVILAGAAEAEHYEIAVYESLIANAEARGAFEIAGLLLDNLEQELSALEKLRSAEQHIAHEGYAADTVPR
jgi:ferritin-like metal-binding protein YciE